MTVGLNHFLLLSAVVFGIGLYGALAKRNVVAILMSIEDHVQRGEHHPARLFALPARFGSVARRLV